VRKISIKGALIGGIVDVVSSVVLAMPISIYEVAKLDLSNVPKDQAGSMAASALHANASLHAAELAIGLCCSMLGGYVAARLAGHDELLNGAASALLCVVLGLVTVGLGMDKNPLWAQFLLFVASPVFGLIGGYLRLRQTHRVQPA
jgi:putative membrane protein (TIGR04086 family)